MIDPFIHRCWGIFAIDYNEDYEPYRYFTSALVDRKIMFLVSAEAAEEFEEWDVEWSKVDGRYKKEMYKRVQDARGKIPRKAPSTTKTSDVGSSGT